MCVTVSTGYFRLITKFWLLMLIFPIPPVPDEFDPFLLFISISFPATVSFSSRLVLLSTNMPFLSKGLFCVLVVVLSEGPFSMLACNVRSLLCGRGF